MCSRPPLPLLSSSLKLPVEPSLQRISKLSSEQHRLRSEQNKRAFSLLKAIAATQLSSSTGNLSDYPTLQRLLAERKASQ